MTTYTTCVGLGWDTPRVNMKTPRERFWSKVNKLGPTVSYVGTPCWVWTASKVHGGYGQFDGSRSNRIAWEATYGPIENGLLVLHKCDNPPCVRPDHLFLGTLAENARDMGDKHRYRLPPKEAMLWGENHQTHTLTEHQVRSIIADDRPQRVIADAYGVNQSTISRLKRGKRWDRLSVDGRSETRIRSSYRGESHHGTFLTADDVRTFRKAHASGEPTTSIAKRTGVDRGTLYGIIKRKTWGHVEDEP